MAAVTSLAAFVRPGHAPARGRLLSRRRSAGRRLADDLVFKVPPAQSGSLDRWLRNAAVVAERKPEGLVVAGRANRVFRVRDLTALVQEWMQANAVDVVLATYEGGLFLLPRPAADGTAADGAVIS